MGSVRPFVERDIPQVASLTWRFLHGGGGPPPQTMESYFRELFFHSPFSNSALPSLVYEGDRGTIDGFLGVVSRRMSLHGKPIEAAVSTYLIVHPESRSKMAALQLIHSFVSRKQDLAITDTANRLTHKVWTGIGGSTARLYAMHWSRPLRPSLYALYALSRRFGSSPLFKAFILGSKPICRILDTIITRIPSSPYSPRASMFLEEELTVGTLLSCLHDLSKAHSFVPEYDRDSLTWLLDFMGRMNGFGRLRKVLLRNEQRKIAGWYIYYVKKGGIGEVVQLGAKHSSIHAVLDHLSYDAWTRGVIALHGRLEPHLTQELSEKDCLIFLGNRLLVHSRNPEVTQLIQTGNALLTRLDGEWCLRFGEPGPTIHRDLAGCWWSATNLIRTARNMGRRSETAAPQPTTTTNGPTW
jgi:hypothetical protein